LVVDPPVVRTESVGAIRKKRAKKVTGGIEEWFINSGNEVPGIDDL